VWTHKQKNKLSKVSALVNLLHEVPWRSTSEKTNGYPSCIKQKILKSQRPSEFTTLSPMESTFEKKWAPSLHRRCVCRALGHLG
jgi:hypothetical protein